MQPEQQPPNAARYSQFVEAWRRAVFPARPSEKEIVVFDKLMAEQSGKDLLILGSTPEFRDLGAKNKLRVTCADINPDMLEGMKQLMTRESCDENLVQCNWLDLPFTEQFDVAFAEQSINIVPVSDFEPFLLQVKKSLKQGGVFVLKAMIRVEETEEEVLRKAPGQHMAYLMVKFPCAFGPLENGASRVSDALNYMKKLREQNKINQEQLDNFFNAFGAIGKGDLHLHIMHKEPFEELLSKHFVIKEVMRGKDDEKHANHPIYILKND